ncbi:uncharacterized protein HaLaN_22211, partial [Haematococcus lacustris]
MTQTTRLDLASAGLMFDHAAQFFTATDPRFKQPLDPGFEGTLVSTAQYGARNKVPQEAVPEDVQDKVSGELLAALARHLGHPGSPAALPEVVYSRCQLWGAALPLNSP